MTVYVDVWERLVTPAEDASLVHPGLGTESCARIRREWVVRVRSGVGVPVSPDPDFVAGHSYYALATLARRNGDDAVQPGDVADQREKRLLVPPANLTADLLGIDADEYRRGQGRPPISLREAINALLKGELPSTPDTAIAPDPGSDTLKRGFLFDSTGGIVAVWQSDRAGGTDQVFASRLDRGNVVAGFVLPPQQVSAGVAHSEPHAALLPNGDLAVIYQEDLGAAANIRFKRASLAGLGAAAEQAVAATAGTAETSPFVVVSGIFAVFFYHLGGATNRWQFRRFRHTDNTFEDAGPQQLSANATTTRDFHAALDPSGNIWAAFRAGNDVNALRLNPATPLADNETVSDSGLGIDQQPFVLCQANGDVWTFWSTPNNLHMRGFQGGAWQALGPVPNTLAGDVEPSAVEDAEGGIWLFWSRVVGAATDIFFMRRNPVTGAWGDPRQMTTSTSFDSAPFALRAPDNPLWVFWVSDRDGNANLYFKRLVTAL
jgi:hypothetical protein